MTTFSPSPSDRATNSIASFDFSSVNNSNNSNNISSSSQTQTYGAPRRLSCFGSPTFSFGTSSHTTSFNGHSAQTYGAPSSIFSSFREQPSEILNNSNSFSFQAKNQEQSVQASSFCFSQSSRMLFFFFNFISIS